MFTYILTAAFFIETIICYILLKNLRYDLRNLEYKHYHRTDMLTRIDNIEQRFYLLLSHLNLKLVLDPSTPARERLIPTTHDKSSSLITRAKKVKIKKRKLAHE